MRKAALLAIPLLLAGPSAIAAPTTTSGSGALALAALVAETSPAVNILNKGIMLKMLNGNLAFAYPAGQKIDVKADSVVCRSSNVDISAHSCELKFGTVTRNLTGRLAHELYATIAEVGVPPDGAAGSIFEGLTALSCTIDPNEVKQKAGGGASCTYTPGP
jgi:hypothetical protein